jgi:microcompartment protein CcmK/EutM
LELYWSLGFGIWTFLMRLGTVIGRVTLSQAVPALTGARWLIVSPFTREHFQQGTETPLGMSHDPSLVVYDDLGGGVGQTIGFIEGREAASPFDNPTPVDAINGALVDEIFYNPFKK